MDKFLEKSENLKKLTKNIVILYHGDCPDGFGAAWASWKKFGDGAEYIGVHHGDNPPDGLKDKEIYFSVKNGKWYSHKPNPCIMERRKTN